MREMKDSGIEWIGEIPKYWDVTKIGKSFLLRDEKNYKSEDETKLLSLYTGRGVFPTGDEGTINSKKSCDNCSSRHNCEYKKEGHACGN